jgi:hypothetical protein
MDEKKSERLEVRLGYQEKQNFVEACDTQGDTPSGAVRRFIKGYVRRSDEDVLQSAWRGAAKRRSKRPIIFIVALISIAIAGLFWGVSQRSPVLSNNVIFSLRDINNDGQLEYAEHGIPPGLNDAPNGVMRVLDLDASGTISRSEFLQEGRMVYFVHDETSAGSNEKGMNLVEFKFTKETSLSNRFEGAKINAKGLDRLVIWPLAGAPRVFEGEVNIVTGLETIEFQADSVTIPE